MAREGASNKPQFRREQEWIPRTNLGRLVKMGKITNIEEIFRHSIRIQEAEIVDHLLGKGALTEELLSVKSVQKQCKAGQKTSMKVVACVGNGNGYIGIGGHTARELSSAIKGAVNQAKMNLVPVRMGQWDGNDGTKHTVATRASGKCGSVTVKVVPAPLGAGIELSKIHSKIFELAGIKDIYVKSFGCTKTTENLAKAIVKALENSSNMYVPDQWESAAKVVNPLSEYSELASKLDKVAMN
ncbi:small subunit ribosomal protein S2e [Enteropsectra breve]|nr:small subunit ribosomal protein S2e [Enteropsectra breve]